MSFPSYQRFAASDTTPMDSAGLPASPDGGSSAGAMFNEVYNPASASQPYGGMNFTPDMQQNIVALESLPVVELTNALAALPQQDLQQIEQTLVQSGYISPAILNVSDSATAAAWIAGSIPEPALEIQLSQLPTTDIQQAVSQAANAPLNYPFDTSGNSTPFDPTGNGQFQAPPDVLPVPNGGGPADPPMDPAAQPADSTLSNMSADQLAQLIASLPNQDIQTVATALTPADQQQLVNQLQGVSSPTDQQIAQALATLPQSDLVQALSQVPQSDIQQAISQMNNPNPQGPADPTGGQSPSDATAPAPTGAPHASPLQSLLHDIAPFAAGTFLGPKLIRGARGLIGKGSNAAGDLIDKIKNMSGGKGGAAGEPAGSGEAAGGEAAGSAAGGEAAGGAAAGEAAGGAAAGEAAGGAAATAAEGGGILADLAGGAEAVGGALLDVAPEALLAF